MMAVALAVGALMAVAMPQAAAQDPTGSIHGHIQNAAGVPVTKGDVKLTTDSSPMRDDEVQVRLPVDQNGNYKSDNTGSLRAPTPPSSCRTASSSTCSPG